MDHEDIRLYLHQLIDQLPDDVLHALWQVLETVLCTPAATASRCQH